MSEFVDMRFPFLGAKYATTGGSFFGFCRFKQGSTLIPTLNDHCFTHCHFQSGSILCFSQPIYHVRFNNCSFESGAIIDLGQDCQNLTMDECQFPPNVAIFHGKVTEQLYFVRSSPLQCYPILPRSEQLALLDGMIQQPNWELMDPFYLPTGKDVRYYHDKKFTSPRSIQVLTFMLWQHPRLSIDRASWNKSCDDKGEWIELRKARTHPNRREVAILLTLMSAKSRLGNMSWARLLPKELIKGKLVGFLM